MASHRVRILGLGAEQATLRRVIEETTKGVPRSIVLSGPAGIGKTTLLRAVEDWADDNALVIRCGGIAGPAAAGGLVADLLHQLTSDAWCRTLPAATAALRYVTAPAQATTVRPRLGGPAPAHAAAVDLLIEAAAVRSVAVLVDDLHWIADTEADVLVDLLRAARAAAGASGRNHLLLVVTCRGEEATEQQATALGILGDEPGGTAVIVAPLDEVGVYRLLEDRLQPDQAKALLGPILELTGGNPLHVGEALRIVAAAGSAATGTKVESSTAALLDRLATLRTSSPTLRHLFEARIAALPPDALHVAQIAALAAEPVPVALVEAVARRDEVGPLPRTETAASVAKARDSDLLRIEPAGLRFQHPVAREVLAALTAAPQQRRWHRAIADWADSTGAEGNVVLHHLIGAEDPALAQRVTELAGPEARRAMEHGDYRRAARFAEAALGLLENAERPSIEQPARLADERPAGSAGAAGTAAELAYLAGLARFREHNPVPSRQLLAKARQLAVAAGDGGLEGDCLVAELRAHLTFDQIYARPSDAAAFIERASGPRRPRVELLQLLSESATVRGELEEGRTLGEQAFELASGDDDPMSLTGATFALGLSSWMNLRLDEAQSWFDRCRRAAQSCTDPWPLPWGPGRLAIVFTARGQLELAAQAAAETREAAARVKDWSELSLATAVSAQIAMLRGDLDLAGERYQEARELVRRSSYHWAILLTARIGASLFGLQGDVGAAMAALDDLTSRGWRIARSRTAAVLATAEAAQDEGATPIMWRSPLHSLTTGDLLATAHAGIARSDVATLSSVEGDLGDLCRRGVHFGVDGHQLSSRLAGQVAAGLGKPGRAALLLQQAVEVATTAGALPELGESAAAEAALLLATGDDSRRAAARLEQAATIASRCGLLPLLRRVEILAERQPNRRWRRRRGLGDAADVPLRPVVLMTDIVGSTGLAEQLGDDAWVDLLDRHDQLMAGIVGTHRGAIFHRAGDGLAAWFHHPDDALDAAIDMHSHVASLSDRRADAVAEVELRIGICCGDAIPRGGDLAGLLLSRTTRTMRVADEGGQTIVGEEIREAASDRFSFEDVGWRQLRGHAGHRKVHRLIGRLELG